MHFIEFEGEGAHSAHYFGHNSTKECANCSILLSKVRADERNKVALSQVSSVSLLGSYGRITGQVLWRPEG